MPNSATPTTFDIGSMRDRIRIQKNIGQQTASGAVETEWVDFANVWASIQEQGGNELFAAQQIYPEARALIFIRYVPGIDESMRILWFDSAAQKDVTYDILDQTRLEENRRHILQVTAKRRPTERNT